MINSLIWLLVAVIYSPVLKILYRPVINGLTVGRPSVFIEAFGRPWGNVSDYTHAYFIIPIFLWLLWRKRLQLKESFLNHKNTQWQNTLSFSVLVFGILMLILGIRQGYLFISTLSLVPFLAGMTGFLYGMNILKTVSFPISYLLFMVPPPISILDSITLPMRHGISFATEIVLGLFNYPITRDGLLLSIGYFEIFMGQPCSGFRSLITMFALVLVYIYLNKSGTTNKIILAFSIIPVALLGNLVRVITLCLITFYFGEEAGQGFFHNFSGIVIFVFTMLGVMGIESLLEKLLPENKKETYA